MSSSVQLLLVMLLIMIKTDNAFSLSCYTCISCPVKFSRHDESIKVENNCQWCVTLQVNHSPNLTRACSVSCDVELIEKMFGNFNYTCCNKNYCNKSSKNSSAYQILLMPLLIIYLYTIGKKW
ncbi:unnamed protein product [Heterobilharzia americana]|nr:unnamed protein product [Heterobilharzia americana]